MNRNLHKRKRRQLKYWSKLLFRATQQNVRTSAEEIARLKMKVQKLWTELASIFSFRDLSRLLGKAGILFGLGLTTQGLLGQSFSPPVINPFGMQTVENTAGLFSTFADMDADGDADHFMYVFSEDQNSYIKMYVENIGTASEPLFDSSNATEFPFGLQPVAEEFYAHLPATIGDLDGDGDLDMLNVGLLTDDTGPGSGLTNRIEYYENIGSASAPNFAAAQFDPFGIAINGVYTELIDIDSDGDLDLLTSLYTGEYELAVNFQENVGSATSPEFMDRGDWIFNSEIPTYGFNQLTSGDIDNDGDVDLLFGGYFYSDENGNFDVEGEYEAGALYFVPNDGNQNFGDAVAMPFGIESPGNYISPSLADLDSDGDLDLVVAAYIESESSYGYDFLYYENGANSVGINGTPSFEMQVAPNPSEGIINIMTQIELRSVVLSDYSGKQLQEWRDNPTSINVGQYPSGVYLLKARDAEGNVNVQKVSIR